MKKWIGVLGFPLSQSRSKEIHEEKIKKANLDIEFRVLEWDPLVFKTQIATLKKDSSCIGFSVTLPYKQRILSYVDRLDSFSKATGVVNCVKNVNGMWCGYNTDGPGFLHSFKKWHPLPPLEVRIVFLGGGATARSLSFSLAKRGYTSFILVNRTFERGEAWSADLKKLVPECKVRVQEWGREIPRNNIFILNTTPLGGAERFDWLRISEISKPVWVFDVTYNPLNTSLLQQCRNRCFYTMNGWPMFEAQAALSFEIWNGGD